jgi:hypothetical protein
MSANLSSLTRLTKADIARQIHDNIEAIKTAGPLEPGLCAFLPELATVALKLSAVGDVHSATVRSADAEWAEIMVRLRGYIGSRARKTDAATHNEARALLKPLLEALQKLQRDSTPTGGEPG